MNNKELLTEKGYSQYAEYWVKTMGYVNEKIDYRTYEVRIYFQFKEITIMKIPYENKILNKFTQSGFYHYLVYKGFYKNTDYLKTILDYYNL